MMTKKFEVTVEVTGHKCSMTISFIHDHIESAITAAKGEIVTHLLRMKEAEERGLRRTAEWNSINISIDTDFDEEDYKETRL